MILVLIAIPLGILLGLYAPFDVPAGLMPFLAIGLLAACNTLFGGIAAWTKSNFHPSTFITGFFFNVLLAMGLTFAGSKLGVDFSLAAIVYFGVRIFNNFSRIQHYMLQKEPRGVKIKTIGVDLPSAENNDENKQVFIQNKENQEDNNGGRQQ